MSKRSWGRRLVLVGAAAAVISLALVFLRDPATSSRKALALEPPMMGGAGEMAVALTDLEDEAGFSAWYSTTLTIDLNSVKSVFRTIETETADYVIGSVPVSGYNETGDPHVYVHRDGWILAYYRRGAPVSKAIDAVGQDIANTNLEEVVADVASAAGVGFTGAHYYDFRYPNATHMLIVAESQSGDRYFSLELPGEYGIFERSFSCRDNGPSDCLAIDGALVSNTDWYQDADYCLHGFITAGELAPDVTHTVSVNGWAAVVIVYRVP